MILNPCGEENIALAAGPSAKEIVPLPANVVTFPDGSILRIRWLLTSPTYTLPVLSTHIPAGELNDADVVYPFAKVAVPEPARVVTLPKTSILRIRLLFVSATYIFIEASTHTAPG